MGRPAQPGLPLKQRLKVISLYNWQRAAKAILQYGSREQILTTLDMPKEMLRELLRFEVAQSNPTRASEFRDAFLAGPDCLHQLQERIKCEDRAAEADLLRKQPLAPRTAVAHGSSRR